MSQEEYHLKEAKSCNNKTWSILDKASVSTKDRDEAIRLVNASYHHWLVVGKPVNFQRSEYMLAKVYHKFDLHTLALHHATRCMDMTEQQSLGDFDLAFAYEIMYRAKKGVGAVEESAQYFEKAKLAGDQIKDPEDRKIFVNELDRG